MSNGGVNTIVIVAHEHVKLFLARLTAALTDGRAKEYAHE